MVEKECSDKLSVFLALWDRDLMWSAYGMVHGCEMHTHAISAVVLLFAQAYITRRALTS